MLPSYIYSLVHIISRCFAPNSYLFESRARENDHPARSTSILYKNIADTCTSRTHTQTRTRTYMHKPLLIRCAVVPDKLSLPPLLFLSQTHTHTHTHKHTQAQTHTCLLPFLPGLQPSKGKVFAQPFLIHSFVGRILPQTLHMKDNVVLRRVPPQPPHGMSPRIEA
jgi:hypothetical protein